MAGSSTYTVRRQRHIAAPPAVVRERIVDLRRWVAWSPWEDLDPELDRTYGGPPAGTGAWYAWEGNRKAGEGRMEITDVDESNVAIDLRFVRPFRSQSVIVFTLAPDADGTVVTWTMTGANTVMLRLFGIFRSMDDMVGPDFERGLDRLKADAEADPDAHPEAGPGTGAGTGPS